METYEVRAYEALGFWTIVLIRVIASEDGTVQRELLYRGDHHPIDEPHPIIRAALLLHRIYSDLEDWLQHEADGEASGALADVIPILG